MMPVAIRSPTEEPGKQLPIPAHPSMLPRRGDVVACREFVDDLDVGCQARPRKDAFEEVVTEKRVFGDPAGERGLEEIDFVDPLSAVRAFTKQVLVNVRDRTGVGIHAARTREDTLEQRPFFADRQRRRDPRLQNCVALDDATGPWIERRSVERVSHLPDQALGSSPWQLCVSVKDDDEADAGRHAGCAAVS